MNTVEDLDVNPKIKTSMRKGLAIILSLNLTKHACKNPAVLQLTAD